MTTPAAHQLRVIDEKSELESRLQRLSAFTSTPTFASLPADERHLLLRQAGLMTELSFVLEQRIRRFTQFSTGP